MMHGPINVRVWGSFGVSFTFKEQKGTFRFKVIRVDGKAILCTPCRDRDVCSICSNA